MRKEIVSLILEENGRFLVEKRKDSKPTSSGAIIFPAGHVNKGETRKKALEREILEELGIKIYNPKLIYSANFDCEEKQKIFWYKCERYEGKIKNNEAEKLLWIEYSEVNILTHKISINALNAYRNS